MGEDAERRVPDDGVPFVADAPVRQGFTDQLVASVRQAAQRQEADQRRFHRLP